MTTTVSRRNIVSIYVSRNKMLSFKGSLVPAADWTGSQSRRRLLEQFVKKKPLTTFGYEPNVRVFAKIHKTNVGQLHQP